MLAGVGVTLRSYWDAVPRRRDTAARNARPAELAGRAVNGNADG